MESTVYFSKSKRDFLTSQLQLGGHESPVLVRCSSLNLSAVPLFSIKLEFTFLCCLGNFPGTLTPTTDARCAVLCQAANSRLSRRLVDISGAPLQMKLDYDIWESSHVLFIM